MERETQQYIKNKGRNKGRWVGLSYNLLASEAWKSLSGQAVLIYIEIKRRYNGSNNGDISLSCREAAIIAHCGKGTARNKLEELVQKGFVKQAIKGRFHNR